MTKWFIILGLVLVNIYQYEHTQNQEKKHNLEIADLKLNQEKKLRETLELKHEQLVEAINEATKRNETTEREFNSLVDANKRLQQTIGQMDYRVKQLPEAARSAYTSALSHVFEQCTERYSEVAKRADGHVSDIRMYQQLNKKPSK